MRLNLQVVNKSPSSKGEALVSVGNRFGRICMNNHPEIEFLRTENLISG